MRPENKKQKKERLQKASDDKATSDAATAGDKLVVIAHDVDPIELVVWLPALCRKMDIPYCIVKSQSHLGALVHQKTATALAMVSVRPEDRHEFSQLVTAIRQQYNENAKMIERNWGGGIMGPKSRAATAKQERAIAKEAAKKAMM